jgi:heme/copper-type cytochrome/quinol oxidase subunit 3
MSKFKFLINSGVWGYEPLQGIMTTVRGHKYHILPANSSPLTISFAILTLVLTIVSNLHLNLVTRFVDNFLTNFLIFFYNFFTTPIYNFLFNDVNSDIFVNISRFNCTNLVSAVSVSESLNNINQLYIFWLAPYFLSLGLFFLWNSNAIEEGTTSKINFFKLTIKNAKLISQWIITNPLFHSNLVRKGFKIGFILFIISEIMFFFGFFWAFFHSALSPTIQIGAVWPPIGVDFITVKGFAVANTVILLTSGATLTIAHYAFELIPQKWIFLFKKNTPWNEEEIFFSSKLEMFLDWGRTPDLEWSPSFDRWRIIQLKRYLWKRRASRYYLDYYVQLPVFMFTGIQKYVYFSKSRNKTENIARVYINIMLNATLMLAFLFMLFQVIEYFISPVNIDTGIYGSTFYMITGLHGFHVFIGTCFLLYCWTAVALNRLMTVLINLYEITFHNLKWIIYDDQKYLIDDKRVSLLGRFKSYNIWMYGQHGIESFECAAWYWHFVDVVWIFVFAFVYVWSHLTVLDNN